VTPNPSLKRRPATAATVWRLQAKVGIVLPSPAGAYLRGRLSSNVRQHLLTTAARAAQFEITPVAGRKQAALQVNEREPPTPTRCGPNTASPSHGRRPPQDLSAGNLLRGA
jgi:hypothetical protein